MKEKGSYLSTEERRRRYEELRRIGREADCDAIVVVGPAQVGGKRYFRYFTDWNIQSFGGFLVVGADQGERIVLRAWSQAYWSRLIEWITEIEDNRDPAKRTLELLPGRAGRVGFVGYDYLSVRDHSLFRSELGERLTDITKAVDGVMGRKSPEELDLVRSTGAIFDAAWSALLERVRPGMPEWQVASIAGAELLERGVSSSIILIGASSEGSPAACVGWPRDRRIERNDLVQMSIEGPGPNGYCVEIGGAFSFRASDRSEQEQLEAQLRGMQAGVAQLSAGRRSGEVAQAVEDAFRNAGLHTGYRGMHGIGLGIPEPPTIDLGDPTVLEPGNVIAMHPNAVNGSGRGTLLSRTYIVQASGAEPVSRIPLTFPQL